MGLIIITQCAKLLNMLLHSLVSTPAITYTLCNLDYDIEIEGIHDCCCHANRCVPVISEYIIFKLLECLRHVSLRYGEREYGRIRSLFFLLYLS